MLRRNLQNTNAWKLCTLQLIMCALKIIRNVDFETTVTKTSMENKNRNQATEYTTFYKCLSFYVYALSGYSKINWFTKISLNIQNIWWEIYDEVQLVRTDKTLILRTERPTTVHYSPVYNNHSRNWHFVCNRIKQQSTQSLTLTIYINN